MEQGCWPCLKRLQSLFHRLDLQKAKHLGITSCVRDLRVFNDKEYTQTLQKVLYRSLVVQDKGKPSTFICGYPSTQSYSKPIRVAYGSAPTRPNQMDQRVRWIRCGKYRRSNQITNPGFLSVTCHLSPVVRATRFPYLSRRWLSFIIHPDHPLTALPLPLPFPFPLRADDTASPISFCLHQ